MTKLLHIIVYAMALIAAFASQRAQAQAHILSTPEASKALAAVFAIDERAFETHVAKVRDKAAAAYLREYMALMKYTAANSDANYDAYIAASDRAFDAADDSPYEDNLLCWLHIHKCMVYIYSGSMTSGGIQFWKSYNAFKSAEEDIPNYEGQLPLRGIYNILLSQVPEKWKSLAGLLGFGSGDLTAGFSQIEQYRQRVKDIDGLRDEALLFSFTNMFFSHDQRLTGVLRDAMRANQSPVIRYAYVLSCGRTQNGTEAVAALDDATQAMLSRFPLLYHQKGKYALRQLKPDENIRWATTFANSYTGKACLNNAYLEMTYAYLLKGDKARAKQMVDKCKSLGAKFDIDRRTQAEAELALDADLDLLRARLQFEFGNAAESKAILERMTPREKDKAEHAFRLARAEDKMGQDDKALSLYKRTMDLSAKSKRYFGPYAAVHSADIMLERGQRQSALDMLKRARAMNDGEYKKELDQRIELTEKKAKSKK